MGLQVNVFSRSGRTLFQHVLPLCVVLLGILPIGARGADPVLYYKLRFEFSTTSDWSSLRIGSLVLRSTVVSHSEYPEREAIRRDSVGIGQPVEDAGQEIRIVFDIAVAPEALRNPVDIELEKGYLGRSEIRILNLLPSGSEVLGVWEHDGVLPNPDPSNTLFLSLDFSQILQRDPYVVASPGFPQLNLAFYFAEYKTTDWTTRQSLKDVPVQPYASSGTGAIARQIDQAKGAGIDGFIVSWRGAGSLSDANLPVILQVAAQEDFKIAIRYQTLDEQGQPRAQSAIQQSLIRALGNYGTDPAFLKVDGRPVIFVADSTLVSSTTWSDIFNVVGAQGLDGFYLANSTANSDLDVFDGLYLYTVNDIGQLGGLAAKMWAGVTDYHLLADPPRLSITTATVQPGYDDELIADPAHVIDRQDGLTYRTSLDTLMRARPDWILISTWNDYYENTHIEPSENYGDSYLRITKEMLPKLRGPRPLIYSTGLVNAASFRHNVVAPGEIVTLFGEGIGPPEICYMQLDGGGQYASTKLCDTEVMIAGAAAPILYTRSDQTSIVVPLSAAGLSHVFPIVRYRGLSSTSLAVAVTWTVPGIFTVDQSGRGQAAALLWPDYSVNGPANPASRSSTVMVYLTAGGLTDPPGEDGRIVSQIQNLKYPVRVEIGGVPAMVEFAGSPTGLIQGVFQINVTIPEDAPAGDAVPMVIWIGNMPSQGGVTLAIR